MECDDCCSPLNPSILDSEGYPYCDACFKNNKKKEEERQRLKILYQVKRMMDEEEKEAEDAYREHLMIEDPENPYNGNPEEEYVMREQTDEEEEGEEDYVKYVDALTRKQKLKLDKFIRKKFWDMNMKELHEMEEEYGENELVGCFNELMEPLSKQ